MHPILLNFRRLGLYLLAWTFLAILVVDQLATSGELGWAQGVVLGIPLTLLYAFICLSSWYACRLTPLRLRSIESLLTIHLAGSIVASFIWIVIARGAVMVLSALKLFPGSREHLARAAGLLFGLGVVFYLLTVAMHYVLLASEASRQAEERAAQAQILAREAELRALRAQVNPHFLFNSLHSISALTTLDSEKAREMCILLGDFLRRTLGVGEKTLIPLADEFALVEGFLRIEKVRFGPRLSFDEQTESGAMEALVPPLILQPLVENAIVHGISGLPEGGWIRLAARRRNAQELEIVLENRFDTETPALARNGVGLANVRRRLEAKYGSRADVRVDRDGDCFRVSLRLPLEEKVGSNGRKHEEISGRDRG
jgi:two-component system, LytTR family, sensor histidine kinase AlgZ